MLSLAAVNEAYKVTATSLPSPPERQKKKSKLHGVLRPPARAIWRAVGHFDEAGRGPVPGELRVRGAGDGAHRRADEPRRGPLRAEALSPKVLEVLRP